VEEGWGGVERHQVDHQVDGRPGRVHPRTHDRLGEVPLHLRLIQQDRDQSRSLGERTALLEGGLLGLLHLDTALAGELPFQVELEGTRAKVFPRKH